MSISLFPRLRLRIVRFWFIDHVLLALILHDTFRMAYLVWIPLPFSGVIQTHSPQRSSKVEPQNCQRNQSIKTLRRAAKSACVTLHLTGGTLWKKTNRSKSLLAKAPRSQTCGRFSVWEKHSPKPTGWSKNTQQDCQSENMMFQDAIEQIPYKTSPKLRLVSLRIGEGATEPWGSMQFANMCCTGNHLKIYDFIWFHMISYDFIWFHMISYDFIWFHMISYDFIWFHMISYDFIWFHMISYDFIWFHMISYDFMIISWLTFLRWFDEDLHFLSKSDGHFEYLILYHAQLRPNDQRRDGPLGRPVKHGTPWRWYFNVLHLYQYHPTFVLRLKPIQSIWNPMLVFQNLFQSQCWVWRALQHWLTRWTFDCV